MASSFFLRIMKWAICEGIPSVINLWLANGRTLSNCCRMITDVFGLKALIGKGILFFVVVVGGGGGGGWKC